MIIEIVSGGSTVTLIDGATRANGKIAGPIDEQEMVSAIEVQLKKPIRGDFTKPLARGLRSNAITLKGDYQGTTEDLTREWALTWPASVPTSGTINIKGATKKVVYADAVIQRVRVNCMGLSASVVYEITCGAISVASL
jgi:hypothetical protein